MSLDPVGPMSTPYSGAPVDCDMAGKTSSVDTAEISRLSEEFQRLLGDNGSAPREGDGRQERKGELAGEDQSPFSFAPRNAKPPVLSRLLTNPSDNSHVESPISFQSVSTQTTAEYPVLSINRAQLIALIDDVVEKLRVRAMDTGGEEVTIQFSQLTIPDTDVSLRFADGHLDVHFVTQSPDIKHLLDGALGELQSRLYSLIPDGAVSVAVTIGDRDEPEHRPDSQGRSSSRGRHRSGEQNSAEQ